MCYRGIPVVDHVSYTATCGQIRFHGPDLYPRFGGREYLHWVGCLRSMPRCLLEPKMDELQHLVGLCEDRPFSRLDVNATLVLRSLLNSLAGRSKMILFSSHVLEVVEKVCHRVLVLRQGQVVAHDSVARLRERMPEASLEGLFAQLTRSCVFRGMPITIPG
jgi:ABC-2 type transport system ATP-binding protein